MNKYKIAQKNKKVNKKITDYNKDKIIKHINYLKSLKKQDKNIQSKKEEVKPSKNKEKEYILLPKNILEEFLVFDNNQDLISFLKKQGNNL